MGNWKYLVFGSYEWVIESILTSSWSGRSANNFESEMRQAIAYIRLFALGYLLITIRNYVL